jgi:kinesin family protein 3/17
VYNFVFYNIDIKTKASIRDRFLVRVSLLEIYNERLSDLLDPSRDNLRIREDGVGGVYVDGLSEHVVRSTEEILKLIHNGALLRKTAATKMNVESSRSHAVFTIVVEHASYTSDGGSVITIGKLRLVDLAGSEKSVDY